MIEHALWAVLESVGSPTAHVPTVVMTDKKAWKEIQESRFYAKKVHFGAGTVDVPCDEKLEKILETVAKRFESHEKFHEKHKAEALAKKRDQPS